MTTPYVLIDRKVTSPSSHNISGNLKFPPKPLISRIETVLNANLPPILEIESSFPSKGKQKVPSSIRFLRWTSHAFESHTEQRGIDVVKMVCSKHHIWKKMFLPPPPSPSLFFFSFQTHTCNHLGLSIRAVVAKGGNKETTQVVRRQNSSLISMLALNTRWSFARFFRSC